MQAAHIFMKMQMLKIKIILTLSLFVLPFHYHLDKTEVSNSQRKVIYKLSSSDKKFLDTLQYRTFLYFWYECNPDNGLVKDRSTIDSPASIAAVGFALPIWAIGVEHKWISRDEAVKRTLSALNFFMHSEQSKNPLSTGYEGLYYHFLNMKTGERMWSCELSTIDTGLLIAGIRFARQYYKLSNKNEKNAAKKCCDITGAIPPCRIKRSLENHRGAEAIQSIYCA